MTKRPSPDEMNFCQQKKVHLSDFEKSSDPPKEIEERTLKKLREGSKKSISIDLKKYTVVYHDESTPKDKKNYNQMRLTNYFAGGGKKTEESPR